MEHRVQIEEMMEKAIQQTNNDRTGTINVFKTEFDKVADYDLLRALVGEVEMRNAIVRLRAKVVRKQSMRQNGNQFRAGVG